MSDLVKAGADHLRLAASAHSVSAVRDEICSWAAAIEALAADRDQLEWLWQANQDLLQESKEIGFQFDELKALTTRAEKAEAHAAETGKLRERDLLELQNQAVRIENQRTEIARLRQKDARVERLREALVEIAKQKKTDELETEHDVEVAAFEDGYDACIDRARAAIAEDAP
jgi:hypothetical protein